MRSKRLLMLIALVPVLLSGSALEADSPDWLPQATADLERELLARYGDDQTERIRQGLQQVGEFWRTEDGDRADFEAFVRTNFAGDQETLDVMFQRFDKLFEVLYGHMNEIVLAFRE